MELARGHAAEEGGDAADEANGGGMESHCNGLGNGEERRDRWRLGLDSSDGDSQSGPFLIVAQTDSEARRRDEFRS